MIQVENLSKTYGEIQALKGVSFTIERGEIVGFLGPNGAGKSTTMKILTGYTPQTGGTVTIDGLDGESDSLAVRRRIGYLPESTPLYTEMLVFDYLDYVGRIRGLNASDREARIRRVAELCGLLDRLGQSIGTLSKGYRQRVGLAQALIHEPDILILDEPTSGLDPNQIVEIRNLIRDLGRDRTIILSTHNLPEVMATCNRMIIVHEGEVVADGTPTELQEAEEANPVIKISVQGLEAGVATEALGAVEGVESACEVIGADPGVITLEVQAHKGTDPRAAIYRLAVERGWELLDLHRQVLDLEGIFRKLTRNL